MRKDKRVQDLYCGAPQELEPRRDIQERYIGVGV